MSVLPRHLLQVSGSADPLGETVDARYAPQVVIADRYLIVRKLGEGGMAEVWLAVHQALKQEVAVKFLSEASMGEDAAEILARFRFEAQVSARLGQRTKHIVRVHDAGEHDAGPLGGVPYLVMEYVRGPTLAHHLATTGRMDPAAVASLLDQVADALSAAHAMGILHRDLKPSNLMLVDEPDGSTTVKVADFGIAKSVVKDGKLDRPKTTALGVRVGSPSYMSPEQVEGRELGAHTDLWSLAVVAYEALTGRDCFRGESLVAVFAGIVAGRFEPVTVLRPDLPPTLDAWFARALAVKPAERFQSAQAMAAEFRAAVMAAHVRRRRVIAAVAVMIAVGLATAAIAYKLSIH